MSKKIIFAVALFLVTSGVPVQAKVMPALAVPAMPAHGCMTCHAVVVPCSFNRRTGKSCTDCHAQIVKLEPAKKVVIDNEPAE